MNERAFAMSKIKSLLIVLGLLFMIFMFMCPIIRGKVNPYDLERALEEEGYRYDTTENIIEATKSKSYFVRCVALELITQRIEQKAIPILKKFLNDERPEVRCDAAHLLLTLGDKSGLERMRQDLKDFAPDDGAPVIHDPNIVDPNEIKEQEGKRNLRLYYALNAAKVLAELGDRRGYKLAERMALNGTWAAQRQEAIYVLVEIAKTDSKILSKEKMNPTFVLCSMADSEKEQAVFSMLISSVQQLPDDIAISVLEKAVQSPHQSEKMRNVANFILNKVKGKKKAAEIKSKDSN